MWIQHGLLANIAVTAAAAHSWRLAKHTKKPTLSDMTKRMDFLAFRIHQNDILYAFIVRWTSLDILKAYFVFHWVNLHFFSTLTYAFSCRLAGWLAHSPSHSFALLTLRFYLLMPKFNDGNANAYLFSMATNSSYFQDYKLWLCQRLNRDRDCMSKWEMAGIIKLVYTLFKSIKMFHFKISKQKAK